MNTPDATPDDPKPMIVVLDPDLKEINGLFRQIEEASFLDLLDGFDPFQKLAALQRGRDRGRRISAIGERLTAAGITRKDMDAIFALGHLYKDRLISLLAEDPAEVPPVQPE